ncbi:MAG: tRNA (guanosine(37)-N1)-methyltransferase TrmD [Clostridia bacterium]|nr:tRNA (guanosine(37)-N1)-methyltransferase TrmD [Clostridia bacterium]
MDIKVFTLFPEMFESPLNSSILFKARQKGLLNITLINFRDYAQDKHNSVDDYPFGGGAGMVLKPEPIVLALEDNLSFDDDEQEIILLSPQGKVFNQENAKLLAKKKKLALICGHYEGFDERIRSFVTQEFSIGDYVLTGGELPAMVMIDAISRLIPGVIKETQSFEEDSFYHGLIEYPQYTRPRVFRNMEVPEILLSGNHQKIQRWRRKESLRRTLKRRPDLLKSYKLTPEDEKLLKEIETEEKNNG